MILFILSFFACFSITAALRVLLAGHRLSCVKEKPVLLGLSIFAAVFLMLFSAYAYYGMEKAYMLKMMAACFFVLIFGLTDDLRNLRAITKLCLQLMAAVIAVFLGIRMQISCLPFWVNSAVSILWYIALMNAFNLLDIMDGLCTGLSFIISAGFVALSIITGSYASAAFFLITAGALLAGLLYNKPPAKAYLGDSGSTLLGFIFASGAFGISYAPEASQILSIFAPVLLLGLPLYDMLFTIISRVNKNMPITKKSADHIALLMQRAGASSGAALFIMFALCALFVFFAVLIMILPWQPIKLLILFSVIFIFSVITCLLFQAERKSACLQQKISQVL
jgi:UDP-GlcNAc:undecaprenyl-phosphate/decaprenyl-phosphate GlcNAc-1-phosphate transferase